MSNFPYPLITVGGLVVAADGRMLFVQSKKWGDLFSLPGGKVEWGETREQAFVREIWEETQLDVTDIRFAIVQECIFSTEFWKKSHFIMNDFIANLSPASSKDSVVLNDEAYHYIWATPQEATSLALTKQTIVLLRWYEKNIL